MKKKTLLVFLILNLLLFISACRGSTPEDEQPPTNSLILLDIETKITLSFDYDRNELIPFRTIKAFQKFYLTLQIEINNESDKSIIFPIDLTIPNAQDVNLTKKFAEGGLNITPKKITTPNGQEWKLDPVPNYAAPPGTTVLTVIFLIQGSNQGDNEIRLNYSEIVKKPKNEIEFVVTVSGQLEKLTAPTIILSNQTLSWEESKDKIEEYIMIINGDSPLYINDNTFSLSYLDSGTYTVQLKSIGSYFEFATSEPAFFEFTKLSAPFITKIQKDTISWNPVEGASYYEVSVDNQTFLTSSTSFVFKDINSGNQIVSVVAMNDSSDVINSNPSNLLSINKLSTPIIKNINNAYITWDEVIGAQSYDIYVNGELRENISERTYNLPSGGTFEIYIVAISDSRIDSNDSNIVTYNRG